MHQVFTEGWHGSHTVMHAPHAYVCAGPVSRLLDHLRMQEPTTDTREAVGAPQAAAGSATAAAALANGMSGTELARRTAAQLSLQSRAEAQAAEEGARVFVHGPGGTMHEHKGGGTGGGKSISVAGLGLKELPAEVFEVGASAAIAVPRVRCRAPSHCTIPRSAQLNDKETCDGVGLRGT